jgi:hypothetical protein
MTIWKILWPFGIIYGRLIKFVVICYIFPNLVCLDQEKSGNPGLSGRVAKEAKYPDSFFAKKESNNTLLTVACYNFSIASSNRTLTSALSER